MNIRKLSVGVCALLTLAVSAFAAVDVPFEPDFSQESTFANWEIVDANNDGYTWQYDANNRLVRIYTMYTSQTANNDYLCLPAINLGKDDIYVLTFSVGSQASETNNFKSEKMRVTFGRNSSPSQNPSIFDDDNIRYFWNGKMKTVTLALPVESDGQYYIAFHCYSPSAAYSLSLKDIKVVQDGAHTAPASVGELTATATGENCRDCNLKFTAPASDADGSPLNALDKIVIKRDGTAIHTLSSPLPGALCEWTDANASSGMHEYTVTPWGNGLEGGRSQVSLWLGHDVPEKVETLEATESGQDIMLSWSHPSGVHGGYTGGCKFTVERIEDGDTVQLATDLNSLTFTDTGAFAPGPQRYLTYRVTPSTSAGSAMGTLSNSLLVGTPYTLPFIEDFEFGRLRLQPWTMHQVASGFLSTEWGMHAMGYYPECPTVDGDDGMLGFIAKSSDFNLLEGAKVRIATPAVSLAGSNTPVLSFMLFHYDTTLIESVYNQETGEYETNQTTYDDAVRVQVSVDNGEYTDLLGGLIMLNALNSGWTRYEFPLDAYKDAGRISIGLLGEASGGGNIFVDAFEIADRFVNDLELKALIGNKGAVPGQPARFTAQVINRGSQSTKAYTVDLYVDGHKVDSRENPGAAIFADRGEKLIPLCYTPGVGDAGRSLEVYAVVNFDADECRANNTSGCLTLDVAASSLPEIESLEGEADSEGVHLSWSEPRPEAFMPSSRYDMEGYESFAVGTFGGFKTIDNDGQPTYGPSGCSYPYAGEANSWQVFDPRQAPVDIDLPFNRRWIAHSGDKCLVCWGARTAQNDDWLISPLLCGSKQTLAFWIKSACQAYEERFQVLYSAGGTEIEDFKWVAQVNYKPNSQWRRFTIELPEGAKRFAIRGTSRDAFAQLIDDMEFIPEGSGISQFDIHGYNVYRNGIKLNDTPVEESSYTDATPPDGVHEYAISALYSHGESPRSGGISVEVSSSGVEMTSDGLRAWCAGGSIHIGRHNGPVTIWSADGTQVASFDTDARISITVPSGVYIVRDADSMVKLLSR